MVTYIAGYAEGRVNHGEVRTYHYPPDEGLPKLSNDLFPDLEPSFVTATRLQEQEVATN